MSKRSNDSDNLTKILRIVRTYGIRPESITFNKRILRDCPIWYHSKVNKKICCLNNGSSICLRRRHLVRTVGEAEAVALLLAHSVHHPTDECECKECNKMKGSIGCMTLHSCTMRVKALLNIFPLK